MPRNGTFDATSFGFIRISAYPPFTRLLHKPFLCDKPPKKPQVGGHSESLRVPSIKVSRKVYKEEEFKYLSLFNMTDTPNIHPDSNIALIGE
jgi:hypothetical protein